MKNTIAIIFLFSIVAVSCKNEKADATLCYATTLSYSQNIAPIIQSHCAAVNGCHNDASGVGNFNFYSEIKIRIDNGEFRSRVLDTKSMPPLVGVALTSEEFRKIKCWYDNGALNN